MRQPLDHLRSAKKPVQRTVYIPLDSEQANQLADLEERVEALKIETTQRPGDRKVAMDLSDAQEEVEELRDLVRENSAKFIAKSMGRRAYEDLIDSYPPTEEQTRKAKKEGNMLSFNADTFPPALIAACVYYVEGQDEETGDDVLVRVTPEFVKEIWESGAGEDDDPNAEATRWNTGEVMSLFLTAMDVNQNYRRVNLGNGSRQTRSS